ncbi:MAG: class I SAM-dependent methyltransferase, partial [Acidobacteriota bacterium]
MKEAYARWAPTYPVESQNMLMVLEQRALLAMLPKVRGLNVLDLACGGGRYLVRLQEAGAARALGLDLSPQMLTRARAVTRELVDLVRGDLLSLPFVSSSFDLI